MTIIKFLASDTCVQNFNPRLEFMTKLKGVQLFKKKIPFDAVKGFFKVNKESNAL